jgi:hypothetical protein
MAQAADEYLAFLKSHPDEREEMESWASVPLDQHVASSPGKKRS